MFDLYFAGGFSMISTYKSTFGMNKILVSYIEVNTPERFNKIMPYVKYCKEKLNAKIFLDSGAYSAKSLGFKLNLSDYIRFVKKYKKYFDVICSLDVIGDPDQTLDNYKDMLRAGCDGKKDNILIPVFHATDKLEYLKIYHDDLDSEYIAIGNIASSRITRIPEKIRMLDKIFNSIPNSKKHFHLFGNTNESLLLRYATKIKSVDSTTWINALKYGEIILSSGKRFHFRDKEKGTVYVDQTKKYLCYNVASFQNLEKRLNEYIQKNKHRLETKNNRDRNTID
jgi:hypothetical protein